MVLGTWGAFTPSFQDTLTDVVRRTAAHRSGPARASAVEEFHQGLSHALMRGLGRQLRSLLMAREFVYVDPSDHERPHNPRR